MYRDNVESTLREIAVLLDAFGWSDWAPGIRKLADEAAAATDAAERSDLARRVLHLYQGSMGSFGDIVLNTEGVVDPAAQRQLEALQSRLFQQARSAL